jgi:hypothetical protein
MYLRWSFLVPAMVLSYTCDVSGEVSRRRAGCSCPGDAQRHAARPTSCRSGACRALHGAGRGLRAGAGRATAGLSGREHRAEA